MQNVITKTINKANATGFTYWLAQTGANLPFGKIEAMVQAAKDEGLNVTQISVDSFLVNHSVWVSSTGTVKRALSNNL